MSNSRFKHDKACADSVTWKSYRRIDGTGGLMEKRLLKTFDTDHLLNIMRTQRQVWDAWFADEKPRRAIIFTLMVLRQMTQKQIITRMQELDEIPNDRYPPIWKLEEVKSETSYYKDFFKKRWCAHMQYKRRKFHKKETKQCS